MAELKDHRAHLALASKDLSDTASKPADVSTRLAKSDPEPAKVPAEASAPAAAAAHRPATAPAA